MKSPPVIDKSLYRDLGAYSTPFRLGVVGLLSGLAPTANPYALDSEDWAAWAAGWQDACAGGESPA